MAVTEKVKEKLDEAGRELKGAIDGLKQEVAELSEKVKERLKGAGEEMKETTEELTQAVKELTEKVTELIPARRKGEQIPVRVERSRRFRGDVAEYPVLGLQRAMNRLFDEFFRELRWPQDRWDVPGTLGTGILSEWPALDMSETDEDIQVTAELPGVDKDDVEVSISNNRLTIRGEKKEQEEEKGRDYYYLECCYGTFQRNILLPCEVDSKKVEASFKRGVLTVKLPKTADARKRIKRIPVRTG